MGICFSTTSTKKKNNKKNVYGSCEICLEDNIKIVHAVNLIQNEHFKMISCQHMFCVECLSGYVQSEINSRRWSLNCPEAGCTRHLSDFDIERFSSRQQFKMFKTYKSADYKERLLDIDDDMMILLKIPELVQERKSNEQKQKLKTNLINLGDIVDSPYKTLAQPFRGVIVDINEEFRTAVIAFDDGDVWDRAPLGDIVFVSSNPNLQNEPISSSAIVAGLRVMAGWKIGDSNYPGTVEKVNLRHKTVQIQYDDGDRWASCPFAKIYELLEGGKLVPPVKCCPQCNVLIFKSEGCDSIMCTCGAGFLWHSADVLPKEILDSLVKREEIRLVLEEEALKIEKEKGLLGSCLQELVAAAAGMGRVEVQEGGIGTTMLKILRGF